MRVNSSVLPHEYFRTHEIKSLAEKFQPQKATLENDYEDFELDIISNFGSLKNHAHMYLGKKFTYIMKI